MMWPILIAGLILSIYALCDAVRKAPVVEEHHEPDKRIKWDMEPFSTCPRWRVVRPEDRGTVVVNEANIRHLERVL